MVLKNFSIVLDSPTGAFYAGTTVSGRVLLSIDKPKKVRGVNVKIEGVAKVHFDESESVKDSDGSSKTRTVNYSAEEEYFSNKFKLLGGGSGEVEIPIGEHVYPFSTVLPPLLPSSFEGEHGSIRYSVKAVVDRPWKFDHETKVSFIVVAPLDLNYNGQAKEPVKLDKEKSFCCLCCQSGPLQLVVSIPQKGYVAGQSIPLTIEIDNASNVEIDNVICKLSKEMRYLANSPKRNEKSSKDELCKLSLEGVGPNGSKSWNPQLSLPQDMPFVNLDQCSIIESEIILKVSAAVSGFHKNLSIEIPLIIGSVPIQQPGAPNFVPGGDGAIQPPVPGFSPSEGGGGFGVPSNGPPPIGLVTPPPQQYFPGSPASSMPPNNSSYPSMGSPYPPGVDQPGVHSYGMNSGAPPYHKVGEQNGASPYQPSVDQPGVHSYATNVGGPGAGHNGSSYPPAQGPYPAVSYPPGADTSPYSPTSGSQPSGSPYPPGSGGPPVGSPYLPRSGGPPAGSPYLSRSGGPPAGSPYLSRSGGPPAGSPYAPGSGGPPSGSAYPPGPGGPPSGSPYPPGAGGSPSSSPYPPGPGGPPSGSPYPLGSGGPPSGSLYPPMSTPSWTPTAPSAPTMPAGDEVGYKPPPNNAQHVTETTPLMDQPVA